MYIIWTLLFLGACTITDLRKRKIITALCFANAVAALIMHFVRQDIFWLNVLGGMLAGAVLFGVSVYSKEAIGKGDAVVVFTLGSLVGIKTGFEILMWASIICIIFSVPGLIFKKIKLKSRIPFMPFMLAGAIITFCVQGG